MKIKFQFIFEYSEIISVLIFLPVSALDFFFTSQTLSVLQAIIPIFIFYIAYSYEHILKKIKTF
jgi:hypothetical protein